MASPKSYKLATVNSNPERAKMIVGKVIEAVWRDGGRFDGWSEHFSYQRWMTQAEKVFGEDEQCAQVDVAWYTTRERDHVEVLPWDHLDSGLDKDWLWEDWQEALDETEVEDCRWTPCFDCGVCPQMGTEIQMTPADRSMLPIIPVAPRSSTPVRNPALHGG